MDGAFDDAWRCVTPVQGRYTQVYFDYSEGWLYILNAWMVDDSGTGVDPDCFNLFTTTTGNGSERWTIKVYGDQTIWVQKNDVVVQERSATPDFAAGAVGFGPSPGADFEHTIFELKFAAEPGAFRVLLGDPVRAVGTTRASSGCNMAMLEEPNAFEGNASPTMWDPSPSSPSPPPAGSDPSAPAPTSCGRHPSSGRGSGASRIPRP